VDGTGVQRSSSRQLDGGISHISFLPLLSSILVACNSVRCPPQSTNKTANPISFSTPTSSPVVVLLNAADLSTAAVVAVPDTVTCMSSDAPSSPFVFIGTDGGAVLVLDCRSTPPLPPPLPPLARPSTLQPITCLQKTWNFTCRSCSRRCLSPYTIAPSFILGVAAADVEDTPPIIAAAASPTDPRTLFVANASGRSKLAP
jgi:hypothetical protein